MGKGCCNTNHDLTNEDNSYRYTLWIVLIINAAMFIT